MFKKRCVKAINLCSYYLVFFPGFEMWYYTYCLLKGSYMKYACSGLMTFVYFSLIYIVSHLCDTVQFTLWPDFSKWELSIFLRKDNFRCLFTSRSKGMFPILVLQLFFCKLDHASYVCLPYCLFILCFCHFSNNRKWC